MFGQEIFHCPPALQALRTANCCVRARSHVCFGSDRIYAQGTLRVPPVLPALRTANRCVRARSHVCFGCDRIYALETFRFPPVLLALRTANRCVRARSRGHFGSDQICGCLPVSGPLSRHGAAAAASGNFRFPDRHPRLSRRPGSCPGPLPQG